MARAGRGLAGAGAANMVSAGLGLLRDALVVAATALVTSDRFFLLFAIFQFSYGLLIGGTRFVVIHRELAGGGADYDDTAVTAGLRAATRDYLAPALQACCAINATAGAAIGISLHWDAAGVLNLALAAAVATWFRGQAEFASLRGILQDRLGMVSVANSLQNVGIIVAAILAIVVTRPSLALLWWGVAAGYVLNLLVLRVALPARAVEHGPGPWAPRDRQRDGSLWLGSGLTAILGLPVLEQLVLNLLSPGLATVAAVARRLVSAPPAILCIPVGAAILNHAGGTSATRRRATGDRAWSAIVVLGSAGLALSVTLVAALWLVRGLVPAALNVGADQVSDLVLFAAAALFGSVCSTLQQVAARAPQADGDFRSPTLHVLVASAVHLAGIGAASLGAHFVVIPLASSLGWLLASAAEMGTLSRRLSPMPPFAWEGALAFLVSIGACTLAAFFLGGGGSALAAGAVTGSALGLGWIVLGPSRAVRDASWL
jgi:hypothetical protein